MQAPLDLWLADLRIRHAFLVVGRLGGSAGVQIDPAGAAAGFHYCLNGPCFVAMAGQEPTRLDEGDFLFMRDRMDHVVWSSAPRCTTPRALRSLVPTLQKDGAVCFSIGSEPQDRLILGGGFCMESAEARHFIDALPPVFCVRHGAPYTERLRTIMDELVGEATAAGPGASPVVARLAEVAVLIGVRSFASTGGEGSPLLEAARDPRLGRAIEAIHKDPAEPWTIARLGKIAGMSRSGFAAEFTVAVGETPAAYIARARMARAERLLVEHDWPLPKIAEAVGYSSAAAFSVAFKRLRRVPPSAVRRPRGQGASTGAA